MQPRYLFIPHKDIIMEIIAYIMQLIAELEKSFFFSLTFVGRTPRCQLLLHRVSRWLRKEKRSR